MLAPPAQQADAVVITAATPPFEIVSVNQAWVNLCGYSSAEAIGSTCRCLQGPETSRAALAELHGAIAQRRRATVRLVNYKKSGERFINDLTVEPLQARAAQQCFSLLFFPPRMRPSLLHAGAGSSPAASAPPRLEFCHCPLVRFAPLRRNPMHPIRPLTGPLAPLVVCLLSQDPRGNVTHFRGTLRAQDDLTNRCIAANLATAAPLHPGAALSAGPLSNLPVGTDCPIPPRAMHHHPQAAASYPHAAAYAATAPGGVGASSNPACAAYGAHGLGAGYCRPVQMDASHSRDTQWQGGSNGAGPSAATAAGQPGAVLDDGKCSGQAVGSKLLSRDDFPLHTLNNHPIAPVLLRMLQLNNSTTGASDGSRGGMSCQDAAATAVSAMQPPRSAYPHAYMHPGGRHGGFGPAGEMTQPMPPTAQPPPHAASRWPDMHPSVHRRSEHGLHDVSTASAVFIPAATAHTLPQVAAGPYGAPGGEHPAAEVVGPVSALKANQQMVAAQYAAATGQLFAAGCGAAPGLMAQGAAASSHGSRALSHGAHMSNAGHTGTNATGRGSEQQPYHDFLAAVAGQGVITTNYQGVLPSGPEHRNQISGRLAGGEGDGGAPSAPSPAAAKSGRASGMSVIGPDRDGIEVGGDGDVDAASGFTGSACDNVSRSATRPGCTSLRPGDDGVGGATSRPLSAALAAAASRKRPCACGSSGPGVGPGGAAGARTPRDFEGSDFSHRLATPGSFPSDGSSSELQQLAAAFTQAAAAQNASRPSWPTARASADENTPSPPPSPWARACSSALAGWLGGDRNGPPGLLTADDLADASEMQLDGIVDMLDNWEQFERVPSCQLAPTDEAGGGVGNAGGSNEGMGPGAL